MNQAQPDATAPRAHLDGLNTYVETKAALYKLLFAVNGGIYALATLPKTPIPVQPLAVGALVFTAALLLDMFGFGIKMRTFVEEHEPHTKDMVFQWVGKLVLGISGGLIILGWLLVALGYYPK